MNRDPGVFRAILVIGLISAIYGCAASAERDVSDDAFAIERRDSNYVQFLDLKVYRKDAGLLVQGVAIKHGGRRGYVPGHIDIVVVSPDGERAAGHNIGYTRWRANTHMAHFSYLIRSIPPHVSVIRVVHHIDLDQ